MPKYCCFNVMVAAVRLNMPQRYWISGIGKGEYGEKNYAGQPIGVGVGLLSWREWCA